MLTLETKEYGTLEYEKDYCITFPDGLFGFPNLHEYLPLCLNEEEDSTLLVFQSTESPRVGFVVINPFSLDPDYHPVLTAEELSYLEAASIEELSFYVICVLKPSYLDNTVNMKCPLVVNPENRKGIQVILNDSAYDFRHKLSEFINTDGENNDADLKKKEK